VARKNGKMATTKGFKNNNYTPLNRHAAMGEIKRFIYQALTGYYPPKNPQKRSKSGPKKQDNGVRREKGRGFGIASRTETPYGNKSHKSITIYRKLIQIKQMLILNAWKQDASYTKNTKGK